MASHFIAGDACVPHFGMDAVTACRMPPPLNTAVSSGKGRISNQPQLKGKTNNPVDSTRILERGKHVMSREKAVVFFTTLFIRAAHNNQQGLFGPGGRVLKVGCLPGKSLLR